MVNLKKNILYYISSHGFGHVARAGQVIRLLKEEFNLFVKTDVPKWLLTQIAGSGINIIKGSVDSGCLQSNNLDVHIEKTINEYKICSKNNLSNINSEISLLSKNKIDLVVSDIASFPFVVSKKMNIPSVYIGNFTWRGIYNFYIKDHTNPIIQELDYQYGLCDYSLITPLQMDMPELLNKKNINLIARRGENIRDELNKIFSIPKENKLVFFYAGNRGVENLDCEIIANIKGYTFLSFYPLDREIGNYRCFKSGTFRHQDITASSDVLIIKPGYGMISEAFVNGVPIIYAPRESFAEYFGFLKEFEKSGGVKKMDRADFNKGNFEHALSDVLDIGYKKTYADSGAKECFKFIAGLFS